MKLSAKPISSPGRPEKFPPPLMRFLRSNVSSRSKGRPRSSPMFVRKKNTAAETQEPSSPKVTCMGQVRVRRSSESKPPVGAPNRRRRRCSKWVQNALVCRFHFLPGKIKQPKSFGPVWRKCIPFFQVGFCRKGQIEENPSKLEAQEEGEDEEFERKARAFVSSASSSSTPPKNALLLTRCRSAPYRSSSLAGRFWGEEETEQEQSQNRKNEDSISDKECVVSDGEEKMEFLEDKIRERRAKSASIEDKDGDFGGSARPLILTRCKSEPARTGEKLDLDLGFWRKTKLGVVVDSCD